jgi:hypothetical protein
MLLTSLIACGATAFTIACGSSGGGPGSADSSTTSRDGGKPDTGTHAEAGREDSRPSGDSDAGDARGPSHEGGHDAHTIEAAVGADGGGGIPPSPVQAGASLACTVNIGTGSGALNYPTMQSTLNLHDGDVVCIASGTYAGGATFSGVTATTGITIQNAPGGTVAIDGPVTFSNLANVVFSGAGTVGTLTGISITSPFSDDIDVTGTINGFTIQNIDLQMSVRYGIYVNNDNLKYEAGDVATYFNNLHFQNITDYATTYIAIGFGPMETISASTGFVSIARNVEVDHCDFGNITPGTVVSLDDVMAASVHHNRFLHINKSSIDHNAIIFLMGYGDIYANYTQDYQGEGARVWPWNIDGTGATVNVYNNINLDSEKYSALEFQPQAPYLDVISILTPAQEVATCNAYDNTAGNMDLEGQTNPSQCGNGTPADPWYSAYIDVYDNGTVNLTNNLVFNTSCPATSGAEMAAPDAYGGHLVNYEGNITPTYSHNLYYDTWQAAGLEAELSVTPGAGSPALGAGVPVTGLTTDFYGTARGNPPSVGAVE